MVKVQVDQDQIILVAQNRMEYKVYCSYFVYCYITFT